MRLFCFTLHFYSPRAYEYLRTIFKGLPSIRTLQYWYSAIDGSPGFTNSAFDALRQKANDFKEKGEPLIVGLIFDDVNIRKHSQYDASKGEFLGHINAGIPKDYEICSPLAKEALVLMVSGIGSDFKAPIGYFLSNGLCSEERAALIHEAILRLTKAGVQVASITCDGTVTNIATYKILGADFDNDCPYFMNPFDKGNKIYIVLDPPHMLKLARNCLGSKREVYDGNGEKIEWKFLEELVALQISQNVNFGNKLTKLHIEYETMKMKVRLAAETLSNSSATSIEYLNTVIKNEKFLRSEATVKYLRVFDSLFDVMNSKPKHCDERFKQPISENSIEKFHGLFEMAKDYIKGLQLIMNGKKVPILKTRSYTPFFGFYHNMFSFIGIYTDYIKPNGINEFYTFDVSQDHLESFFGCMRRMGGSFCIQFSIKINYKGAISYESAI